LDLLGACLLSVALLSLAMALLQAQRQSRVVSSWVSRLLSRQAVRLEQARIAVSPGSYLAFTLTAPPVLFVLGWLQSPVVALIAGVLGLLLPGLYVKWLVAAQVRRSEAEAPRFLQLLLTGLSVGGTYLDALRQARQAVKDPWLREDLDYVLQRFMLDVPLEASIQDVRGHVASRNLSLIWETIAICCATHVPTHRARALFLELSSSIEFNAQLGNEVRARASGQRIQIWLLALLVPSMYLYLRVLNPELLSYLDQTIAGRYLLLPAAAVLEVTGIYLSLRVSRIRT
jgi:Flp pilus assembly protein TadB